MPAAATEQVRERGAARRQLRARGAEADRVGDDRDREPPERFHLDRDERLRARHREAREAQVLPEPAHPRLHRAEERRRLDGREQVAEARREGRERRAQRVRVGREGPRRGGRDTRRGAVGERHGPPMLPPDRAGANHHDTREIRLTYPAPLLACSDMRRFGCPEHRPKRSAARAAVRARSTAARPSIVHYHIPYFPVPVLPGFCLSNASALSLAPFGHNAGSASALMGAIQMSIGACTSALVSVFQNKNGPAYGRGNVVLRYWRFYGLHGGA